MSMESKWELHIMKNDENSISLEKRASKETKYLKIK